MICFQIQTEIRDETQGNFILFVFIQPDFFKSHVQGHYYISEKIIKKTPERKIETSSVFITSLHAITTCIYHHV